MDSQAQQRSSTVPGTTQASLDVSLPLSVHHTHASQAGGLPDVGNVPPTKHSEPPQQADASLALPASQTESWVQCDRCGHWRRVKEDLLESLSDESNWYCEDNPDERHNHCNVPQEMTNDEIDRGRAMETLAHERMKRQRRPAVWQLVRDNIYTHRKPKKLYEDDIMVCQCKPASQKGISCHHEDCLNGMLNIECVNGFCSSGKECQNQRFQRRQYSKFEVQRAGLKGFGLFALEDIKKGGFIVEYVGEVLDEEEYLRRKEYYHSVGQRHYYFMNIGNGEVVDACRKGNRARFINHSCEPNAETQKWMVKGELKIGFFATKDITAGTEIQFDYNFERYGDKPTKCHCAAPSCRGFIGGSSDRYAGVAVDDAGMQGLDLAPIMITGEIKDAKLAPHLELVMDQVVGIGLGEESVNPALEARLRTLAAQQGSAWEPEGSPEAPAHPTLAQVPSNASAQLWPVTQPPAAAPPLAGPLIQQPLKHLQHLQRTLPPGGAPVLPPLSDAALAAAGAPPELFSTATLGRSGSLGATTATVTAAVPPASSTAAAPAAADANAGMKAPSQAQPRSKQKDSGKATGEDTASGETRLSDSDLEQEGEEEISSDSDAGPPAEDDDWLDSADRYKELPGTPPTHPVPVPPAAKRKRTQRPQEPVKRTKRADASTNGTHAHASKDPHPLKRSCDSNGATKSPAVPLHSAAVSESGVQGAQLSAQQSFRKRGPNTASPAATNTTSAAHVQGAAALKSDADAAVSNEPDSAASVVTGAAQFSAPPGTDAHTQQLLPGQKRKGMRVVVKTLSPAKAMQPGNNNSLQESSSLKEGSASAAVSATAGPPISTASASEASASVAASGSGQNSLKRPAWPKTAAKNASSSLAPAGLRKRSEIERRLEQLVGAGAHRMLRVEAVKEFVRLFNMCDISPPTQRDDDAWVAAVPVMDDIAVVSRRRQQFNTEVDNQLTHRQRARMADLSLLLEKVLGASGHTLKKELLRCGLLSRLQFCAINNYGMGYTQSLRKICRAVQALPVTTTDIHARRSAQGSFGDVLRALTSHGDREVRKRSYALLDAHVQPAEEREKERRERPERGAERGWDRGGEERAERPYRGGEERGDRGGGGQGGVHRQSSGHGAALAAGSDTRRSTGGGMSHRGGMNGMRNNGGGGERNHGGAVPMRTGSDSSIGHGGVSGHRVAMPTTNAVPSNSGMSPFPIRPPPPPPPPRSAGLPAARALSPGGVGMPPLPHGTATVRPGMHTPRAPYPHDSPAYPTSGAHTSSPGYGAHQHQAPPAAPGVGPPLPGSSGLPPRSPMYPMYPMHSYPQTNGAALAHPPQHMHDYHAYPPSEPEPPPPNPAQPPLPPEPAPNPPPFYRADIKSGKAAAQKRLQESAARAPCMQSMIGVPASIPQALQLGLYDAAKILMRRSQHYSSQRRNA